MSFAGKSARRASGSVHKPETQPPPLQCKKPFWKDGSVRTWHHRTGELRLSLLHLWS